jgi:acetylornithine/LysW-gamma-L-lysine aminotransferase
MPEPIHGEQTKISQPELTADQQLEEAHGINLFNKRPISIVRGSGATLYDADGNEYIDCGANYGTCNVGHCNTSVVEAIKTQSEQLLYIPSTFYSSVRGKLMQKLVEINAEPLRKVFLCNSGSEAVEAALKFARVSTSRTEIIAMTRGFHGRTLGALSATHNPKYRKSFEPLVPHFTHVSFGNMEVLEDKISDNTAAVIIEPVLGEGGVIPSPPGYLESVRELCNTRGTLMILDEIQTGFGRTGAMFAYEKYGVVPDIICLAKSIAGGLPMGAVVATEKASNIPKNAHGSTFGGNPFMCAAALASIQYIVDNNLTDRAKELGDYFLKGLNNLDSPIIRESRGFGLMLGLELKKRSAPYLQALIREGILALPAGKNVIRFLPPLVIDKAQIDIVLDKLEQVIRNG